MITMGLALAFSGFVCLSLTMPRHYKQMFESSPAQGLTVGLRLVGWVLLMLAIVPCVVALGPSVGLAIWCALLTIAAVSLLLMLNYAPGMPVPLACGLPLLAFLLEFL